MSHARPMYAQQLPTGSVVWLILAMVFVLFVIVPGALTSLALLVSHLM